MNILEAMNNYKQKEGENFFVRSSKERTCVTYVLDDNYIVEAEFLGVTKQLFLNMPEVVGLHKGELTELLFSNNVSQEGEFAKNKLTYDTPTIHVFLHPRTFEDPLIPGTNINNFDFFRVMDWIQASLFSDGVSGDISRYYLSDIDKPICDSYIVKENIDLLSREEERVNFINKRNIANFFTGKYENLDFISHKPAITKELAISNEFGINNVCIDYSNVPIEKIGANTLYFGRQSEEEEWIGDGINKTISQIHYSDVTLKPSEEKKGFFHVERTKAIDNEEPYVVYKEDFKNLDEASKKFAEICGAIENKYVGEEKVTFIKQVAKDKAKEVFSQEGQENLKEAVKTTKPVAQAKTKKHKTERGGR